MTEMLGGVLNRDLEQPLFRKKDIIEYCWRKNENEASRRIYLKLQKIYSYYLWKFSNSFKEFKKFVFKRCLLTLDILASGGFLKLQGKIFPGEYFTLRGFHFLPAKYFVFRFPVKEQQLNSFLAFRNLVLPVTENYLKFYFQFYNPFEYFSIKRLNKDFPDFALLDAIKDFIRKFCNKYILRVYPFLKIYNPYNIVTLSRLFLEYNEIASGKEELRKNTNIIMAAGHL